MGEEFSVGAPAGLEPPNTTSKHIQELEVKLSGAPAALENLWRTTIAPEVRPVTHRLISTYYDTSDLRLRRRGLTLRVRDDGHELVQTMKTESGAAKSMLQRSEWSAPISDDTPDLRKLDDRALLERIGLIVTGELSALFTTEVTRQTKTYWVDGGNAGQTEIEAALDIGEIRCDRGTEPIAEIELELVKGSALALQREALRIHGESPCQFQPLSKSQRGFALALCERPKGEKIGPPKLTPETSVEDSLERVLSNCMKHWLANHAAVLDGRDPEGVHQTRVAMRRLRSALTIFKGELPPEDFAWLNSKARWLATGLGEARDWDVFGDQLLLPVIQARPDDPSLRTLRCVVADARQRAHEHARVTLQSPGYLRFVLELSIWLERRGWRRKEARSRWSRDVIVLAAPRLDKRHRQAMKLGRNLSSLADDALHLLRISLKKLRYTHEFFACLYDETRTRPYLRTLRSLQDDLGRLNDVAVAEARLRDLCERYTGGNADALQKASGTVLGWHSHALFMVRPRITNDWLAFADTKAFWLDKGGKA